MSKPDDTLLRLLRLLLLRVSSQDCLFRDVVVREYPPLSEAGSSTLEGLIVMDEAGVVLDDGSEADRRDATVPLRMFSLLSLLPASKAAKSAA